MHAFPSTQSSGVPAWHVPSPQTSPAVQAFPSLHGAVLLATLHPVAGLQVSVVHALPSSQLIAVPWHVPPPQKSSDVQALPSSQATALLEWTHPKAESQESSVQGLSSSQSLAGPPRQVFVPSMTTTESMSWPMAPTPLSLPMRHRNWIVCPAAVAGSCTSVLT